MADCGIEDGSASSVFSYRIGGLFGILAASCIGFVLPVIFCGRFKSVFFLFSTFASGVVLATGFVHVLPDAEDTMSNPCLNFLSTYPLADVIALFAALVTFTGEHLLEKCMATAFQQHEDRALEKTSDEAAALEGGPDPVILEMSRRVLRKRLVAAYTLEAGIIFHSIFVGIALGTSHKKAYVQGLTFALLFHQGFEGLALGGALAAAKVSFLKLLVLGLLFALTTPVGIAIGMGIGNSYNPNNPAALACEGVFNSISAGILIYNALADLLLPTFDTRSEETPKKTWLLCLGFISLLAGAGGMSVLAIWA